ncbi:MAG TPA: hypothetical protein VGE29_07350 [Prosthecobacter sp.]
MSRANRLSLAVLVLSVIFAGKFVWETRQQALANAEAEAEAAAEAGMKARQQAQAEALAPAGGNRGPGALPGDAILQNYGLATARPQDDLDAMAHTFSNLLLLVKGDSPFRMGANEEFAAALLGKNRDKLAFVSPDNRRVLNSRGQIIDRWGTPLYFHTTARDRVDIRSAGPDGQMWTADDVHRRYDGQFLKGEALNPDSLFQEAKPGDSRPK